MLALHDTFRIRADHILHLRIPNIHKGEEVEVLLLSKNVDTHAAKIALIAEAARDPLYQKDMDEIADDFGFVDSEQL